MSEQTQEQTLAQNAVQLQLIPDEPVRYETHEVALDALPDVLTGDPPSAAMVESVRRFGVLQPIVCIGEPYGDWETAFGRRRIRAARLAGLATVPVHLYPPGWTRAALLSLVENEQRRPNPVADYLAINELVDGKHSEADIAEATGLSLNTVRARLRLARLIAPLHHAMLAGDIRHTVAEAAAKLSDTYQKQLADILEQRGRLTLDDVRSVTHVAGQEAAAGLPDNMFEVVEGGPAASARSAGALLGEALEKLPGETPASYIASLKKLIGWLERHAEDDGSYTMGEAA